MPAKAKPSGIKTAPVKPPAITPAVKAPTVKKPAVKPPPAKTPVVKKPAVKPPTVKPPTPKTPAVKTPVVEKPAVNTATTKPSPINTVAAKPTAVKTPDPKTLTTIHCAENIAVLNILHNVPSQPSSNLVTTIQSKENGYSVSFEDERKLTSTLAFLAYREDDPDHIPAVCVHSTRKKKALKVLLAVNRKGSSDKWRRYADYVKEGFDEIAAILNGADDCDQNIENEVFVSIVELCKARILCRLRLEKKRKGIAANNKQGTTIVDGLNPVVGYLHDNPSEDTKIFLKRAQRVLKLASSYMAHQTTRELEDLIEGINSLRQTEHFEDILRIALCRDPNLQTRYYLSNMIRKVSRYREAARVLRRLACRLPPVRRMLVEVVELPSDVFERSESDSQYCGSINSMMSRIPNLKAPLKDVKKMCNLLGLSKEEANAYFNARFKQISKESKVHAEIQLLYHCETRLQANTLQPRVICSSKSACWLCNAFLLFHGKMHTPRSHGRLYTGWRLPNPKIGWCNDIATRFNQHLEAKVAESLRTLHQRQKRTNYPEPNGESELSIITWLSSSEILENDLSSDNIALSKKLNQPDAAPTPGPSKLSKRKTVLGNTMAPLEESVPDEHAAYSPPTTAKGASAEAVATAGPVAPGCSLGVCARSSDTHSITSESPAKISDSPETPSTPKEASNVQASHGSTSSVASEAKQPSLAAHSSSGTSSDIFRSTTQKQAKTYSVTAGEVSPVYTSGPLRIQFEYAGKLQQQQQGKGTRRQLSCKAEWLSSRDAEQLTRTGVTAVDLNSLTGEEVSYNTDGDNNIYLGHGGRVLRLTMRPT